jgi:toxin FitB
VIVLDTNVLSEPLKKEPSPNVMRWLDAQDPESLYLPSIVLAEVLSGIAALPAGKRRSALQASFDKQIANLFEARILSFDAQAAAVFGGTHAAANALGNAICFADCAIAAIAKTRQYMVATRNTKDFRGTGVILVNPWA